MLFPSKKLSKIENLYISFSRKEPYLAWKFSAFRQKSVFLKAILIISKISVNPVRNHHQKFYGDEFVIYRFWSLFYIWSEKLACSRKKIIHFANFLWNNVFMEECCSKKYSAAWKVHNSIISRKFRWFLEKNNICVQNKITHLKLSASRKILISAISYEFFQFFVK